ncbi:hypothetical protein EON79_01760 [bacterium]|nr:MAG: hypothetical protein EON79_01760 [bacterium]
MKRALWLGLILAGCGGGGQSGLNSPSMPQAVPSSRKVAEMDPRVESKMVTKEASVLKFNVLKAEISVPAGAVEGSGQVSGKIPVDLKTKPEDNLVAGSLIAFTGPKFAKPVDLVVQKPKKKGVLSLVELKDGKWVATKAVLDPKKNVFTLSTGELGTYAVYLKPKAKKGEETKEGAAKPTATGVKALAGKPTVKFPK